ncbi:MAG TPA: DUF4252 domain-containing protein [Terracidiphilus sp.]|nr:DUF4252 domain-containing protein [Terracidiphilus sp.]
MKRMTAVGTGLICATMVFGYGAAQAQVSQQDQGGLSGPVAPQDQGGPPPPPMAVAPPPVYEGPVVLEWTPPALQYLSAHASMKESFTLDRTMLAAAAGMLPDSDGDARVAINRLDGVSVHMLRFPDDGAIDEDAVASIRAAYHLRGWKHLVTTTDAGGPVHNNTTDVWMVLDGVNVRGAVVLAETPKSVTLVTVAGNISPVDLLHLRGHFGIPQFDQDHFGDRDRR